MSNKSKFEFRFEEKSGVRFADVPSGTAFVRLCAEPRALYVKLEGRLVGRIFAVDSHQVKFTVDPSSGLNLHSDTRVRPIRLEGFFGEFV